MNDKMLDLIGQADEEYLREAEGTSKMKIKHKRRLSAKVAAIAAAAAVMTVTAGAVAVAKLTNRKSVEDFYDSSAVSRIENRGYVNGTVSENEHFRITLETVLKDDYKLLPILTVEPLDKQAEDYLADSGEMPYPLTYYTDTKEYAQSNVTCVSRDEFKRGDDKFSMKLDIPFVSLNNKLDINRPLMIKLSEGKNLTSDGVINEQSLFNGIELKLDNYSEVKSTKLYSEKGNELYLSEFGFVAMVEYPDNGSFWSDTIVYSDGRKVRIDEIAVDGQGLGLGEKQDTGISLNFKTFIDPESVEAIGFMGETFKRK